MSAGAWPDGSDVDLRSLRLGRELGKGGQGTVHEVESSPYAGLVFKRYFRTSADAAALKRLVDLPSALVPGKAELLRRQTAWPLARVMDGHEVCGFVMQPIPQRFRGRTASGSRPRELQYLLFEPTPLWGDISPPDVDGRIDLARQIVSLIHLLHSHAVILGDISMNNLLWACDSTAAVFMIDCDGVRRLGSRPVHPQGETPDWTDPLRTEPAGPRQAWPTNAQRARPTNPHQAGPATAQRVSPQLDLDNDRYKSALVVGRILSRDAKVRPGEQLKLLPGIPAFMAARVQSLWQQAARPRGSRPDTNLWISALGRQ